MTFTQDGGGGIRHLGFIQNAITFEPLNRFSPNLNGVQIIQYRTCS